MRALSPSLSAPAATWRAVEFAEMWLAAFKHVNWTPTHNVQRTTRNVTNNKQKIRVSFQIVRVLLLCALKYRRRRSAFSLIA